MATILESNKKVADFISYLQSIEIAPGFSILDSFEDFEDYLFLYFQKQIWNREIFDITIKVGDVLGYRTSYFFYDKKTNKMAVCYVRDIE